MASTPSFGGPSSLDQKLANGVESGVASSLPHSPLASTSTASPSVSATPNPPPVDYAAHEHALSQHLLSAYLKAEFCDAQLVVSYAGGETPQSVLMLHSVVIARSPLLRSVLQHSYQSSSTTYSLALSDPSITPDAFCLAIAYLYSPTVLTHVTPALSAAVLATANYLSLDSLAAYALEVCSKAIASLSAGEEIARWFAVLEDGEGNGQAGAANGNGRNGYGGQQNVRGDGASGRRLRAELTERVLSLPVELGAFSGGVVVPSSTKAQSKLIDVLASLPFASFKEVLESPRFPIREDMDRFNLGKKIAVERKRRQRSQSDFEEAVVLQFGGGGGPGSTAVQVLRKARRPNLWKVNA